MSLDPFDSGGGYDDPCDQYIRSPDAVTLTDLAAVWKHVDSRTYSRYMLAKRCGLERWVERRKAYWDEVERRELSLRSDIDSEVAARLRRNNYGILNNCQAGAYYRSRVIAQRLEEATQIPLPSNTKAAKALEYRHRSDINELATCAIIARTASEVLSGFHGLKYAVADQVFEVRGVIPSWAIPDEDGEADAPPGSNGADGDGSNGNGATLIDIG